MSSREIKLNNPPETAISSIKFGPKSSQYLAASAWDRTVRFYDVSSNALRRKFTNNSPVLDVAFMGLAHLLSGSTDSKLRLHDINTGDENIVGSHNNVVRCVEYVESLNGIVTGSWDKTIKLWDVREKCCVGTYKQCNSNVYSMSVIDEKIAVAPADCKVLIWDLRNMRQYLMKRESSLQSQTRCIRLFPNKEGYAMSSFAGPVAVEYVDPNPMVQQRKFTFKCHGSTNGELYPVHSISFHNIFNTFATGGSKGIANIWDPSNKNRLCQFHQYDTSISSLNFSHDGSTLAIACSYIYERENPPAIIPSPSIYVRYVTDEEVKPK